MTARPWTKAELEVVRSRYEMDGPTKLARELGRTEQAVRHRGQKLGVVHRRRWTAAEEEELCLLWGEKTLPRIAAHLRRSPEGVYRRAECLGLTRGVPQGFEALSVAARRTGYCDPTLRKILAWAGVKVRRTMSRPPRGKTRLPCRFCVDPFDVDRAVKAWLATETIGEGARRHGYSGETLRKWLAEDGKLPESRGRGCHVRVESTVVDTTVAARKGRSLTAHAHRLGLPVTTLWRWLIEAGVPRERSRPWLMEPEIVDRIVHERGSRRRRAA